MKPLLVGSVFGPSARNKVWLKLQSQFLKMTTDSFDYVAYLNNADRDLFSEVKVIGYSTTRWEGNRHPHANALNRVLSYFRKHPYRYYLILDSDCFPVTRGWINMLTSQMEVGGWKMAAPVRAENLDLFPHPCAFFIKGEAIHDPQLISNQKRSRISWALEPGTPGRPFRWENVSLFCEATFIILILFLRPSIIICSTIIRTAHAFLALGRSSRPTFNTGSRQLRTPG